MKIILLSLLFCSIALQGFSQSKDGDIHMDKTFWSIKFHKDGRILNPRQVLDIMKDNPQAHTEFKKAKSNYGAASAFGFIGGALIGWPIGTALGGGDPQWGLAGAGAGFVLLSIPFSSAFNKHAKNAIAIYNGTSASARPYSITLIPYGTGAKVSLRF